MSSNTIRVRKEDVPISEADTHDLEYWSGRIDDDLEENPNGQWASRNRAKLALINAELEARRGKPAANSSGGKPREPSRPRNARPRPSPAPLAKVRRADIEPYVGSHTDAKAATEALARLQELGHVISPASAVAALPEGTALVISPTLIDVARETYSTGNSERGLSKSALNKLAGAVGIAWSGTESRRLDNGSDARYVHYRAVGYLRDFSGQIVPVKGEKVMDLRDGSPQIAAMRSRAESKAARSGEKVADWKAQLRDMRLFILEHAETKAQLRAIRSLPGVRTSFTKEELAKPFFGVRLQLTGQSDDPELRRMFAERIADSFLSTQLQLFGPQTPAPAALPEGTEPPPIGSDHDRGHTVDTEGEPLDDDRPAHDADGVVNDNEEWPEDDAAGGEY